MYEVEKLIGRVEWIRRYKAAPFLEERNSFLLHLHGRGFSARQLKVKNKYLLGVVELIDLGECVAVDPQRLERAATEWVVTPTGSQAFSVVSGAIDSSSSSKTLLQRTALRRSFSYNYSSKG